MKKYFNLLMNKKRATSSALLGIVGIKLVITLAIFLVSMNVNAQKFAFVDTEYILKRVPAYEAAQEQLKVASTAWQQEVEKAFQNVSALYKSYQTESVFLSPEMKTKRENEIVEKEKLAKQLQQKYFGAEGELFKKREALIKPVQDDVYSAISAIAAEKGLSAVFDKASNVGVLFSDPKVDISDEVIKQMGL
jgi:outer membrane protein